ncbi:hypothetical protein [Mucilaginibacter psychrotolerans]|uniref:Uncharacterized protein n=1 Tax=Mucilaginibacter psychrotolerans TaxID=1524096 RepID=A0A4Y8S2E3_9SPHI|nr:hypothetical protein [Mucilaginibacter psychrotolerans]TFF32177.1 hypothetical protein E2R66_27000 [Mucilaginibacter psychrotolerans]
MKKLSIITVLCLLSSFSYGQLPWVKVTDADFVGKTFKLNKPYRTDLYITSLVYNINKKPGEEDRYVMPLKNGRGTDYSLIFDKVFKCTGAAAYDSSRLAYYIQLYNKDIGTFYAFYVLSTYYPPDFYDLTCIEDEAAVNDIINNGTKAMRSSIDSLGKLNIGKRVWIKNKELGTYNDANKTYGELGNTDLRFTSATITRVSFSGTTFNPCRIFAKVANGTTVFFDTDFNTSANYQEYMTHTVNGKTVFEKRNRITDGFFLKDPVLTYHLTPSLIKTIKKGDVYIGMNKNIVLLIEGEPEKINRSTNAYTVHEQWVYSNHTKYYYFDNGKLTNIQD